MIAFDTNVLLRLLLDDDETQSRQVEAIVSQVAEAGDRILLPDIVLCELSWVLRSVYEFAKADIVATLRRLLTGEEFAFVDRRAVSQSLESYANGSADFSDYLMGQSATATGATTTYTFDRALRRTVGFSHPAPVR